MKRTFTKKKFTGLLCASIVAFQSNAQLTENFDNITTLTGAGWFMQNNSVPVGSTNWFQGNGTVFAAFNGAADSYIGANFNNTTGANTISNWLVTPNFTIKNGDVITFYTHASPDNMWADNLQVRMSTNGASTNVGTGSAAVGDFTTLLLEINPTLSLGVYPYLSWQQYTITVSGLSAPTSGRFAFRYYVPNGGPSGANSDYIGIDNFVYTPYVCPTLSVTPASLTNGTAGVMYSQSLSQTGALGTPTYSVTAGSLPPGMTLTTGGLLSGTPTGTGTYNFTVTVSDASGCSGSTAYSLTISCPTNGATLASFPTLCSNDSPYIMSEGSPSGGVYSGTGVTGSSFNPSSGTQTITYSLTDVYGCPQSDVEVITVNTAPTVTLNPYTAICDNDGMVPLTGGESPAGGVFSGTGVSGNNFDASSGTQNITYTYTDGNGCSNSSAQPLTVNAAPAVSQTPFTTACEGAAPVVLSGGTPAGGTYSGTGVSGGNFDPATAGIFAITYTVTAGNGCTNSAVEDMTVVACLGLNENDLNTLTCYPNPSNGLITVQFNQTENTSSVIRVFDAAGRLVMTKDLGKVNGNVSYQLDLSEFGKGIYTLEVTGSSVNRTQIVVH